MTCQLNEPLLWIMLATSLFILLCAVAIGAAYDAGKDRR